MNFNDTRHRNLSDLHSMTKDNITTGTSHKKRRISSTCKREGLLYQDQIIRVNPPRKCQIEMDGINSFPKMQSYRIKPDKPRIDAFGTQIVKGSKTHKISFIDYLNNDRGLAEVIELKEKEYKDDLKQTKNEPIIVCSVVKKSFLNGKNSYDRIQNEFINSRKRPTQVVTEDKSNAKCTVCLVF